MFTAVEVILRKSDPLENTVRPGPILKTGDGNQSLPTPHRIIPDAPAKSALNKRRSKKRVRFAEQLESRDECASPPDSPDSDLVIIESVTDSQAAKQDAQSNRQPSPVKSQVEVSASTNPADKSPDLFALDAMSISTSLLHTPRLTDRATSSKKATILLRNPSTPLVHSYSKQRINLDIPIRPLQSRRPSAQGSSGSRYVLVHSAAKQANDALSAIPPANVQAKIIQAEHPVDAKTVHDYFQSKQFTDIITNSQSTAHRRVQRPTERFRLPQTMKNSAMPHVSRSNLEFYVFGRHAFQPIPSSAR